MLVTTCTLLGPYKPQVSGIHIPRPQPQFTYDPDDRRMDAAAGKAKRPVAVNFRAARNFEFRKSFSLA